METHQVLKLPPRLLDNTVLSPEDDAHARQVADLRPAHDQRVDVEPAPGQNARHARQHTRLVLHQTVQDVPVKSQVVSQHSKGDD